MVPEVNPPRPPGGRTPIDPLLVAELRTLFRSGVTPSAVVRRIARRHTGEPNLDRLVRHYFQVAFDFPAARIGPEMVSAILAGEGVPGLNDSVLHRMIETRPSWDDDPADGGWLDGLSATDPAVRVAASEPENLPELAASWERLDDAAKACVRRLFGNVDTLHEKVRALAALAERLQQQLERATPRPAPLAASA